MTHLAFDQIPVPDRATKPRRTGVTMMIDWGIPLASQTDIITSQGHLVDKAKIAGGIPRFMPRALLMQKLAAYKAADISTANGGLFTELALAQGTFDALLREMAEVGFASVEVSENLQPLSTMDKTNAVRHAKQSYGLDVLGEVGRKEGEMTDDEIMEDVETYLNAGVSSVYLEANELFDGDSAREGLIRRLADNFPPEVLIFELPVDVIPGITKSIKHKTASQMVATLGTDVNLANLEHDEIYLLECLRLGVAGDTRHAHGAFRLAGIGA
ncbi:phosphosulfolactate synthase [Tropicibacter sp. Alg240-R139]|uniref:phosphosulfolactate synthase n=1 Tax=Tropicibacter sp. Alg240-R139 TaxID=2305991 RepID=UPI0013DFDCEF|nr:phosphosulfolactate synthase [Tropicibacter sp. Alg240-R139]